MADAPTAEESFAIFLQHRELGPWDAGLVTKSIE